MGAWGVGPFENDDAMDFVGSLEGAGLEPVEGALDAVTDGPDSVESHVASVGLAAAEAVAVLRGRPAADVPAEVTAWAAIGRRLRLSTLFFQKAQQAAERIKAESELKALWAESGEEAAWTSRVDDLISRLATG